MSRPVDVFTSIYASKAWGDGSGGGSDPGIAGPYIEHVRKYVEANRPKRVVDIGCGDLRVAASISWSAYGCQYIGYDAGPASIALREIPGATIHWGCDVLSAEIEMSDLLLCKEVLQHLPNAAVQNLLKRTAHHPVRMFTNSVGFNTNADIPLGGFRSVDLVAEPFKQNVRNVLGYGSWVIQTIE